MPKKKIRPGNAKGELTVLPPKDLQAAINELVYKHGANLRNQDQPRIDVLKEAGVDPDTVKDLHWDRAESALQTRLIAQTNGKKIDWPLTPTDKNWGTGIVSEWTSLCGRYNIVRFNREKSPGEYEYQYGAEFGKSGSRRTVETESKDKPGYARYYDTLREAADAVIRHHLKEFKMDKVGGNTDNMVKSEPEFRSECQPIDDPLAIMPEESPEHETPTKTTEQVEEVPMPAVKDAPTTVILKESQVRKMFAAMGLPEEGWSFKTVQKKLSDKEKFSAYASTGKAPDEGTKEKRTFDKVTEAFEAGLTITLEASETEAEASGHSEPKAKKRSKDADKEGKDKFGSRIGSQAAAINAVVTGKAKTIEVIAEETKLGNARVRSHLKWMEENGFVVNGDKGYSLKK